MWWFQDNFFFPDRKTVLSLCLFQVVLAPTHGYIHHPTNPLTRLSKKVYWRDIVSPSCKSTYFCVWSIFSHMFQSNLLHGVCQDVPTCTSWFLLGMNIVMFLFSLWNYYPFLCLQAKFGECCHIHGRKYGVKYCVNGGTAVRGLQESDNLHGNSQPSR